MKESVRQVILDLGHMKKKGREMQISYPSTTGVDIKKKSCASSELGRFWAKGLVRTL